MNLLNEKSNIAGDSVVHKLSKHHDGEREVFLSKSLIAANRGFNDAQEEYVILTVYNLKAQRYGVAGGTRKRRPDLIEETRFLKEHHRMKGLVPFCSSGICTYDDQRLGWVAQKFISYSP